jgi:hypothetical protein
MFVGDLGVEYTSSGIKPQSLKKLVQRLLYDYGRLAMLIKGNHPFIIRSLGCRYAYRSPALRE